MIFLFHMGSKQNAVLNRILLLKLKKKKKKNHIHGYTHMNTPLQKSIF